MALTTRILTLRARRRNADSGAPCERAALSSDGAGAKINSSSPDQRSRSNSPNPSQQ
jgi:hypothetical protein